MSQATRHSLLVGSMAQIRCASAMASSTERYKSRLVLEQDAEDKSGGGEKAML